MSDTALPALLPCPFCGTAPRVIEDDSYGSCQVFCVCEHEPSIQRWKTHLPEAIAAWNKRAPPPAIPGEVVEAARRVLSRQPKEPSSAFFLDIDTVARWVTASGQQKQTKD